MVLVTVLKQLSPIDSGILPHPYHRIDPNRIISVKTAVLALRTCIHNLKQPSGRAFSCLVALKNLEIHKGFLWFFALQGGKIPRPSSIFDYEYRFLVVI